MVPQLPSIVFTLHNITTSWLIKNEDSLEEVNRVCFKAMRGPASLILNAWSYVEWLSRSRLTVCWSEWTRWRPGQADLRSTPPGCPIDAYLRQRWKQGERWALSKRPSNVEWGIADVADVAGCFINLLRIPIVTCWTTWINVTCRPPANNLMPYRSSRPFPAARSIFDRAAATISEANQICQETLQNISSPEDFVNFMQQEGMSNEDIQRTARRPSWNRCPEIVKTCEYVETSF
jgi:hypothetical protein